MERDLILLLMDVFARGHDRPRAAHAETSTTQYWQDFLKALEASKLPPLVREQPIKPHRKAATYQQPRQLQTATNEVCMQIRFHCAWHSDLLFFYWFQSGFGGGSVWYSQRLPRFCWRKPGDTRRSAASTVWRRWRPQWHYVAEPAHEELSNLNA